MVCKVFLELSSSIVLVNVKNNILVGHLVSLNCLRSAAFLTAFLIGSLHEMSILVANKNQFSKC